MPYPFVEHSRKLKLSPSGAHTLFKRATGQKLHASNYDYNIQNAVYNQLHTGELSPSGLLKTDNRQQFKLLETVCQAANKYAAKNSKDHMQLISPEQVAEIEQYIAENLQYMTPDFLDYMEKIAMASGLFVLAHTIRKQTDKLVLQIAQKKEPHTRREKARLNWARLNCGDALFESNRNDRGLQSLAARDLSKPAMTREDNLFADYVKGKSCAIVGPSSSGANHIDEIKNDFDIIIRMNYRGRETLSEQQRELPLHIAYYNGDFTEKFSENSAESIDYLADMDFAVLKAFDKARHQKVLRHTKVRAALKINGLFFRGSPNMLQVIMQDLSWFEPARVKAFYVNLSLTETQHDEIYLKSLNRTDLEPLDQWRSWSKHSMITQYDYIRLLFEQGILEADTRLTEVLKLGTAGYVKALEEQESRKTLLP